MRKVIVFIGTLIILAITAQFALAAIIAFPMDDGFKDGWGKENPSFDMSFDVNEKALKIVGANGANLEYKPTETFKIGENKNRYMKISIKGDPNIKKIVAYFITEEEPENAVYGPTVRVKKDCSVNEATYTDIIFDLYLKGEGYGSNWEGTLRKLRVDIQNAEGTTPSGIMYVKYIAFADSEAEAQAYNGTNDINATSSSKPQVTLSTSAGSSASQETESSVTSSSSVSYGQQTSQENSKTDVSDGKKSNSNIIAIVLGAIAVIVLGGGIIAYRIISKKKIN